MHCLHRRLKNTNISVTSLHPGVVATELSREVGESVLRKMAWGISRATGLQKHFIYSTTFNKNNEDV